MKRGLGIIALGGLMLVIAVLTSLLLLDGKTSAPEQATDVGRIHTVTLTIPGSKPIPVLAEDFRLSSSTWVVVSKSRPLPQQDYVPATIIVPSDIPGNPEKSQEEQSIRKDIVLPLSEMLAAAKKAGHELFLASGYRSYALQEQYYTNYVRTSGQTEADRFSARPGNSEHQTGLSFDLSVQNRQCYLDICFANIPAGKWLADNAHTYGFIVRYPADKTSITGYQYEPWHFRYVGKDLAFALHAANLTLDEILPQLEAAREQLIAQKLITE